MERLIKIAEWLKRRYWPVQYDSTFHPAEAYYASIYLEIIERHLGSLGEGPLRILEPGCGTGRLLVPLARRGHYIKGIDFHRDSLRMAKKNIEKANVGAELIDGDLIEEIGRFPDASFDAVISIEVLYNVPRVAETLIQLSRLVRKGGLLMIAHRTRFYYILYCLAQKKFEDAYFVATNNEGRLPKGHHRIYYNWQTAAELDELYGSAGMEIVTKHPIGPYSGLVPDPLEPICDPGKLSGRQRELLHKIEAENFDPDTLMASRYLLVVAQKKEG